MAKKKTGRWVTKSEMSRSTGISLKSVVVYSSGKNARIEKMIDENDKRWYWLDDGQVALSAASAKKLRGEKKENEMPEGKLISVPAYVKETGLSRSRVYLYIQDGLLETEKNDEGKLCIFFVNKTHALKQFQEARNAGNKKIIDEVDDEEIAATKDEVDEGEEIGVRLWSDYGKIGYQFFSNLVKKGIFDECRLKVTGKKFKFVEWPGPVLAKKIVEILTRKGRSFDSKKHMLNKLLNVDIVEPIPEPIPEPIVEIPPEPVAPEPCEVSKMDFNQLKTTVNALEQKLDAMGKYVKAQMEF